MSAKVLNIYSYSTCDQINELRKTFKTLNCHCSVGEMVCPRSYVPRM